MIDFYKKINKKIIKGKFKFAIAYSGGLDSSLMLEFYSNLVNKKRILLIHINHNISKNSKNWENFCKKISKKKNIKIIIKSIHLNKKNIKKKGVENEARDRRYKEIIKIMKKRNIKYVIFAHFLDDLVETFFLRILRGTSLKGLECMKKKRKIYKNIYAIRPFLYYERKYILNFFKIKEFIKDESNKDLKIRRNFIRKIIKILKIIYKDLNLKIKSIIYEIKNYNKFIKKVIIKDIYNTKMNVLKINKLSRFRKLNLLSYIIGKNIKIPSKNWLLEVEKQLLSGSKKILIRKGKFEIKIKEKKILIKC
ncbi:tRNA lysidine(34) synthetase TilS [Candidatus Vidania fulgoroideorum]